MKLPRTRPAVFATLLLVAPISGARAALPTLPEPPTAAAARAVLDLATTDGLAPLRGRWRYSDVRIVEAEFRAPDAEGQPNGAPLRTYDYEPRAGAVDFDDSAWPTLPPETLGHRRGHGRLGFNWYRLRLTVPDAIGGVATRGSTLVFETQLDDYAEVWVDGELPRAQAQSGGSVVAGWNTPNRLVIGRDVRPGQEIQLAIFGMNGPISQPPTNFIYVHHARLELHDTDRSLPFAVPPHEVNVEVVREHPALDAIVPANPKVFKLAEGFEFTEGPVWVPGHDGDPGHLLFSDPNANRIYRYDPEGSRLTVFREHSGYGGADIAEYHQPGSNGLTLDPQGRLVVNQHGDRRVVRLDPATDRLFPIAERYDGKRLNSPNDLVYRSDGTLYFTDPFFGLPKLGADPRKELPHQGVYRVRDGQVTLLSAELTGPNGIALSPDETFLYVGDWDERHKVVVRYPVHADGALGPGETFVDLTGEPGAEAIDGIKVDRAGNLYVSGPGGLHVVSASGERLGTIRTPRHVHNLAWGDADGRTLYLCARDRLYRMRLEVEGVRP